MSLQKYRADRSETKPDGAIVWYADWLGGPTVAKISNCRIHGAERRLTVYITGEPDSWFSVPAATRSKGKHVGGFVTSDDDGMYFRPMDKYKDRL